MQALLLAAGVGARLRPLTEKVPKCLVPFDKRPLIDIWIKRLVDNKISRIYINTHYLADQVDSFVQKSRYREKVCLIHEDDLRGTAGTLFALKDILIKDEPILIAHADNLSVFHMNHFIETHIKRPKFCEMTMMLFETDSPSTCGIVGVDAQRVMNAYEEKPTYSKSNLANGAVFIMEYSLMDELIKKYPLAKDFCLEVLPNLIGRVYTYKNEIYHRDIGSMKSYEMAVSDYSKNHDIWKSML